MSNFEKVYEICKKKIDKHMQCLTADNLYEYRESKTGNYESDKPGANLSHMFNWMTSFVTGLAPMMYRTEKDVKYLRWSNSFSWNYYDKIFNNPLDTMHDIGFLYSPYSVAMYQLTGDIGHKNTAVKAADEFLKRYDIKGKYIDAWGRMDNDEREGRAIVDCMINIQLLFWAWKETGHTIYRDVAKAHADTTVKYFIRDDYSVCHSFNFDRNTGKVADENNDCGYSNGSHWARGTAWLIYGLAMTARYLDDKYYYDIASKVLDKYMLSANNEAIPVWDFRLPKDLPARGCNIEEDWDAKDIKNCVFNVDTSAAAIVACAICELNKFEVNKSYEMYSDKILTELCEKYFNTDENVLGMISHQNGRMVYTTYGDFFFVQALQQKLYNTESCW